MDEKDVRFIGPHCPIHQLKVNKVHAAEHLLHSSSVLQEFHLSGYEVWYKLTNVLEEENGSVSIIKMEEPTTSKLHTKIKGVDKFLLANRVSQPRRQLSLQTLL